ncbi:hypothetical protein K491DRAFT_685114 [Lophiostoma macrostomum CBS 122681]|uniref:Uncharacterized protein n=1 Tax=Lophiostoma macrostomum CBS 122681 TaxID=1314788 RepID=A0A6A6SLS1_9PLEO|nr:hypothetical protein K491DRAFT_685114 [Lophiostoma macrostomum CBS 122681]
MSIRISEPAERGRSASKWYRNKRSPSPKKKGGWMGSLESFRENFNGAGFRNQNIPYVDPNTRMTEDAEIRSQLDEAFFQRLKDLAQEPHGDLTITDIFIIEVGNGSKPEYYKIYMEACNDKGEVFPIGESEHGENAVEAFKSLMQNLEGWVKVECKLTDAAFAKKFPPLKATSSGMSKFPKSPYPRLSDSTQASPIGLGMNSAEGSGSLEEELTRLQKSPTAGF